jgi:hypothetical protein
MTAASLFGSILFSAIGLGAFIYGKKAQLWKPALIGFALMVYPYVIWETRPIYVIGCILTAALFVFRD